MHTTVLLMFIILGTLATIFYRLSAYDVGVVEAAFVFFSVALTHLSSSPL